MTGRVRTFSDYRGYGFFTGDDGRDFFVHHTMIDAEGFRSLQRGDAVEFDPVETPRGWQAWKVVPQVGAVPATKTGRRLRLRPNPFTPQDPVVDPNKFAGRAEPLANAIDCLFNNKNLLVTGPR
jgi:cold shock protein